jgi:hypothetical protein
MESNVSQSETDKNSYEVIFKFPNMTSMSIFMVEFDQFRKEQIKVTIKTQEKKKRTRNRIFKYKKLHPHTPMQQCVDRVLKSMQEELEIEQEPLL